MQIFNEELQSIHGELQNANGELRTAHSQVRGWRDGLAQSDDGMQTLLNGMNIATIFLDQKLQTKRSAAEVIKLVEEVTSGEEAATA